MGVQVEVISIIVMFVFGNLNDEEHQMTKYIPMESLTTCMKEVRLLKKKNTDYKKDAFCGPALVEMEDGVVIKLHSELPEGAILVDKKVSKKALEDWTLKSKEKWEKD